VTTDKFPLPARRDRVPLGIAFMVGATLLFSASFAISKWQVTTYSFAEVLFFRSFGSLVVVALLILPRNGFAVFRTHRLGAHLARNATQSVAQSFITIAFGLMPLGGAVAINFSAPLFATLAAALWLKEKVGSVRGLALVAGFGGVLVVAGPGADTFRVGALFAIANAVLYGSVTAAVRGMSKTESAETLTIYSMLILTLIFAAVMPLSSFVWPGNRDLAAMLINGIANGIGQYLWTRSLTLAPPAAVGPFYYFSLIWAMVLGFVFWGDIPSLTLLAGAAVVITSGLFLLWHESSKNGKKPVIEPAEI
jgi:drug/metabolite transporter (DMT)-like permease